MSKLPRLIRLFLDAKGREAFDKLETLQPGTPSRTPRGAKTVAKRSKLESQANATREESRTIREALDAAQQELEKFEPDGTATPRERLIRKAIGIHRSKQQVLSDLSPEERLRLQALAQAILSPRKG